MHWLVLWLSDCGLESRQGPSELWALHRYSTSKLTGNWNWLLKQRVELTFTCTAYTHGNCLCKQGGGNNLSLATHLCMAKCMSYKSQANSCYAEHNNSHFPPKLMATSPGKWMVATCGDTFSNHSHQLGLHRNCHRESKLLMGFQHVAFLST